MVSLNAILDRATGAGRRASPINATIAREISEEDILKMAEPNSIKPQAIQSLRQSHHTLARLLAIGTPEGDIALITGYSISRISILKGDPTFAELLKYYEGVEAEGYKVARADMHLRLSSLGFDTLEVLHERLLDAPEKFSVKELAQIVELTADRIGHGKTSTVNNNVQHSVAPETLAAIRSAAQGAPVLGEEDRQALLSMAREATAVSSPEAADWIEGEGTLVREEGPEEAEDPDPLADL